MSERTPAEIAALALAALRMSAPLTWRLHLPRWRARAASAFFQAGVARHRRLFLSEMVDDLEASASQDDPAHAARETLLLHEVNDQSRESVARYYEVAIALAPGFAEPLYNLASLRRDSGRREEALSLFLLAAQAQPHSRAKPHALVVANALWEAADIMTGLGRLGEAEASFRRALALNGNFGPDHVRFPRLLQRLGKNQEAVDHFELITPYSHRYAAEFVEPDYHADEMLPRLQDGTPFDPLALTRIDGDEIYYWAHLYFRFAKGIPPTLIDLQKLLENRRPFFMQGRTRSAVQCSPTRSALALEKDA
jgi:tetratricopeptide (TPR) repeat protein